MLNGTVARAGEVSFWDLVGGGNASAGAGGGLSTAYLGHVLDHCHEFADGVEVVE